MSTLIADVSNKLNERKKAKDIGELKGFVKSLPGYLSELVTCALEGI